MSITQVGRRALCFISILIAVVAAAPSSAQDLVVARAESLNEVFDGAEAISKAIGQEFNREMVLGMGSGMLGSDLGELVALDRPVAAVMPVEGMMLQQNGVVVAIPVTDATAAIEALASRFPNHTVNEGLHTFTVGEGPPFHLTAADGYLRVGGNADLVTRFDPLAAGSMGSTLAVELTLEPIAPMIEAGLAMGKAQMMTSLESAAAESDEITYDPEAMGSMADAYFDGIRWLVANTSSLRLRLDVEDGYVRFAKDLIPREDSELAGFIEAQKGGLPEIAKLADQESAWYMAGQVTLNETHRQGLKTFVDGYMDLMSSMLTAEAGASEANGGATDSGDAVEDPMAFWNSYMAAMGPYAHRWIDCMRGDMVFSFHSRPGEPFQFMEALGVVESDECADLVGEMSDELIKTVGSTEELGEVFTATKGPKIGRSESLVMSFDMVGMLDEMGQATDEQAAAMMKAMYGEQMSAAMVAADDVVLVAGGTNAVEQLGMLAAALPKPAKAPTFAPLEVRPGLMMGTNIGAVLNWARASLPEGEEALDDAAKRLSGDTGRVPMAVTFASQMATFDMAVSLETIEVIAELAAEERAREAEAEAEAVPPEG